MAKILVIESDADVRSVISHALQRVGHTVLEEESAADGFDLVLRQKLDVVIADTTHFHQNAMETIQRIRQLEPDLPIIAMSGVPRGEIHSGLGFRDPDGRERRAGEALRRHNADRRRPSTSLAEVQI